jgi:hexosaminidase
MKKKADKFPLIPLPNRIDWKGAEYHLAPDVVIYSDEKNISTAELLVSVIKQVVVGNPTIVHGRASGSTSNAIEISCHPELDHLGREGYQLDISENLLRIKAPDPKGIFYGIQTIKQMLPMRGNNGVAVDQIRLPGLFIEDAPRFSWRGFMLDEGRHFHGKETVKRLLDIMAQLKMNVFHWHLTEDQGWRIEIVKYPRLTALGANRPGTASNIMDTLRDTHDGVPHSGFYTQEEIREIVSYASERNITVVPEIDIPGHSMAALAAYPDLSCTGGPFNVGTRFGVFKDVLCPGKDETFTFLKNVFAEIVQLFPGSYIHIGGDEAPKTRWKKCPACQARIKKLGLVSEAGLHHYLTERIARYLMQHGKMTIGWSEILFPDLEESVVLQYWIGGHRRIVSAMEGGRQVIASHYLKYYLDHSHSLTSLRNLYEFEPAFSGLRGAAQRNLLGIEAPLWTEFVPNQARLDFQVFPRLLAVAETGWTHLEEKDLSSFYRRYENYKKILDLRGIQFADDRDADPSWLKRTFGIFTILQTQRKTADSRAEHG